MKDNNKRYWKGLEELNNDPSYLKNKGKEFPADLPRISKSEEEGHSGWERRDFLKMMGFSVAAASLAACEAPVRKAIPYLNKPVDVDPGIANYYASTYLNGGDYCSVLVKTREGRPIKIEGNELSKVTYGGTNAQVQASVLSLYDEERLRGPQAGGTDKSWAELDQEVIAKLNEVAGAGGQIRIVSNTILSPTTLDAIEVFKATFPNTEHVVYDQQSAYGIAKANETSFGSAVIPSYDFGKAQVIVGFDADFLGTWISPLEFSHQYSQNRKVGPKQKSMSRHYHVESNMSLTGANADYRIKVKPSQQGSAVATLYNLIAGKAGAAATSLSNWDNAHLKKAADDLWNNRGSSLVVSGSNDPAVQILVNAINDLLGNYGTTIDLSKPVNFRKGNDEAMNQFIDDVKGGGIGAVVFYNCNPVYDHARGGELSQNLSKVGVKISTNDRADETASLADYIAPDNHYLESWNDAEPKAGNYSLAQPTIAPLFDTRQAQSTLLTWAGNNTTDYYTYLQNSWKTRFFDNQNSELDFQIFWDKAVHDGVMEMSASDAASGGGYTFSADFGAVEQSISSNYKGGSGLELAIYQKVGVGTGSFANNPLVHELPDPVTKVTWDNYVTLSQTDATEMGIEMGEDSTSMVDISVNGTTMKAPAVIQPGQAEGTIGLSIGFGRTKAGKVGNNLGVNAYPAITTLNGTQSFNVTGVTATKTEESYRIARTQTHQTYMDRGFVVQEDVLSEYQKPNWERHHKPKISTWSKEDHSEKPLNLSLWKGHKYDNHHWGMAVDMNSCTGCSACLVACNVENNIPVVGKDEVLMRREMHWLRIDRYYSSSDDAESMRDKENPEANPEVTFQPMMCQHCNNAPCETVCPVAATTHSTEGLNQMAYNRCIGTRYCANNCPYKVRRFNWFKYHDNKQFADFNTAMNTDLGKMVLNPDVVVRSRGVMEKCSLCVQRIQAGKLEAKKNGQRPKDGEITTACAQSCPTNAITFGDMLDANSEISRLLDFKAEDEGKREPQNERAYFVLEEVGVSPNIYYMTKIRNKDKA